VTIAFGRLFAGSVLSVGILAACAGSTAPSIPPSSLDPSSITSQDRPSRFFGKWMYLAQFYGEDLAVYKRANDSLQYDETITQGVSSPQGTVATPNGWWYVANGVNVLVYRSTSRGPIADQPLNDPGEFAVNVDVMPSRQLAAVSNASSSSSGAGSVSVYLKRQVDPTRTLTYGSDPVQGTGVAIDRRGNCYWAFNDPTTHEGSIVEFARCQGNGSIVVSGIADAQGMAFDQRGNLYYVDQPVGIYRCYRTSHCRVFSKRFDLPVALNFDQKDKLLWVADAGGYVDAVNSRGRTVYTLQLTSSNPPFGIAPAPGG
jgi:hypothetical protein